MEKEFKLSRKRKKRYQKDDICFKAHWIELWPGYRIQCWEWFYFKQRVIDRHKHIYI